MTEITKEDFKAYEEVRDSGITNMFNVKLVEQISGIEREKIYDIMKNYDTYIKKFIGDDEDMQKLKEEYEVLK